MTRHGGERDFSEEKKTRHGGERDFSMEKKTRHGGEQVFSEGNSGGTGLTVVFPSAWSEPKPGGKESCQ